MGKIKTVSEAPESNAGDDFHILWGIKKTFDLLNFDEFGLKAITIEGIGLAESEKIDPTGRKLLGIDIVEFYGEENFKEATKVIVSQLKYSTRRADEEWTFYKLYESKNGKGIEKSIINKLALIFKTFFDEHGRDETLSKLSLKFISNRNFNSAQKNTLLKFQSAYNLLDKKPVEYDKIGVDFSKSEKTAIAKIYHASGLSSFEFSDFLSIFDLDDCGALSREFLNEEIYKTISSLSTSSTDEYNALHTLVWKKMMPESKANNYITKEDLLMCFKCVLDDLFPVNQKFELIQNKIDREQLPDILNEINNTSSAICLHGGAGIGKSTISQLIASTVPNHCESLLFDCYGGGDYLNPSDKRHDHREALTQLSNELAKKLSTPFLLLRQEDSHIFLKQFFKRVRKAIDILRKRNPSAYLLLIIDAADNSITAADNSLSESFVQDLMNENLPDGFKLVVTTRTNRKNTLKLPHGYIDIPLQNFSLPETTAYIQNYFPSLSDREIADFHKLTSGIPRVQSYTLDFKKMGIQEVINYLKPNGKEVKDLILDRITEAAKRIGDNGHRIIEDFFRLLIALPRPVPLSYLQKLNPEDSVFYTDLSTDIWHGLVLHNGLLSFRDEDFENFIRKKFEVDSQTKTQIANLFIEEADSSEYASINLGFALYDAAYKNELKDIVIENKFRDMPSDPIRSKEIYIERTKLAMKLSSHEDDKITYFKLLMIAADEAKKETALTKLLIDNAELSALFSDDSSLYKINRNSEESAWGGSFNFKLAAIYSRNEETHKKAKDHLKIVEKWIDLRQRLAKEERGNYSITNEDLAYGMEAYLRLKGVESAITWINRWKPKEVRLFSALIFMDNVFSISTNDEIEKWIHQIDLPLEVNILIINKLHQFEKTEYIDITSIAKQLLQSIDKLRFAKHFRGQLIEFCELLLKKREVNHRDILEILDRIETTSLNRVPSFYNKYHRSPEDVEMDLYLRKKAIQEVINDQDFNIENYYPKSLTISNKEKDYDTRDRNSRDKNDFQRFFNLAIPIYRLNANYYTGKITNDQALIEFHKLTSKIKGDWEIRYHKSHESTGLLNFLAIKLLPLINIAENQNSFIAEIIESAKNKNEYQIPLRILIAQILVYSQSKNTITLTLLNEIDTSVAILNLLAHDAVEYYIDCALIATKIDSSIGQHYFNRAVDAVSGIDIEAFDQIKGLSSLTKMGIPKENPKLAYEFSRFIEFSYESLSGYDHFPFYDGIIGLINLDIRSAYAITCRWNHKDIGYFFRSLKTILKQTLDNNDVDDNVVASLLTIPEDYQDDDNLHIYKNLIDRFSKNSKATELNYFLKATIKQFKLRHNHSFLQVIYDEIKDNRFVTTEIKNELHEHTEFQKIIKFKKSDSNYPKYKDREQKHNLDVSSINSTSTASLEEAIKSISIDLEKYEHRLTVDNLLEDLKVKCSVKDQVPQLDAILNLDKDIIDFFSIEKAFEQRLSEWKINPVVRNWAADNFKIFIELWFSEFIDEGYGVKIWLVYRFAELFGIENNKLSKLLTDIFAGKIDVLFSEAIYSAIELLKYNLTPEENEVIIAWSLDRWNLKIKKETNKSVWNENLIPPQNHNEVIAGVLRYILGHPDKRIRWNAVHAVRRVINLGCIDLLNILFSEQNNPHCTPFQQENFTFYWMSSKLYLWIGIMRVSEENPSALYGFADKIYAELKDETLPHALIRHLIKKTCLNLIKANGEIYNRDTIASIKSTLKNNFESVKEDRSKMKLVKSGTGKKTIFHFDSMDTLPYWFGPLARKFNMSENDIARLCDNYISNIWNYRGDPHKDDHTFTHGNDYYLTRNDHGSLPVIENLRTYYEYHAMFCAANELITTIPLVEKSYMGNWNGWLKSNAISWGQQWLYDMTDEIPMESRFWLSETRIYDKKWKDEISIEVYDEAVQIKTENPFLNVFWNLKTYDGDVTEDIHVRSCLVSTKTSDALLRALVNTKDRHDYSIPLEKEKEVENDNEDFQMLGWLREYRGKDDTLDKHDGMSTDNAKYFISLGKYIQSIFELKFSANRKEGYHDNKLVSKFQSWSNVVDERYHSYETSGDRLQVDKKYLLKILKTTGKSLVIKCYIDRQLKERDYQYGTAHNTVKLYLIKPDGTVKTLREPDFRIGQ